MPDTFSCCPYLLGFAEGFRAVDRHRYGQSLLGRPHASHHCGAQGESTSASARCGSGSVELLVGVLLFSKTEVLVTILFVMLAVYHQRPSLLRLAIGAACLVCYLCLAAAADRIWPRASDRAWRRSPDRAAWRIVGASSRAYLRGDRQESPGSREVQGALARFSYVNAATMVVAWYDLGRPGATFEHALAAFVPRLLWPDKPDISASGRELYTEATGNVGTSISPGLPAEAYWNFGWWGVPLLMLPLGVILAVLANASTRIMSSCPGSFTSGRSQNRA